MKHFLLIVLPLLVLADDAQSQRCVEGNCTDGIGTLQVGNSKFVGKFTEGKLFGYGLVITDDISCEAYMIDTKFDGLAHCFLPKNNYHVLQKMKGKLNNGPQIIISSSGDIISFDMYQGGKRIDGYFGSDSNKRSRQGQELRNFQAQLGNLRRSAPDGIEKFVPRQLKTIPKLEVGDFESPPALRRERMTREVDRRNPEVIKTLPEPVTLGGGGTIAPPNTVTKGRSELADLALIAADLNANRRQVNPSYRLERVRIEPSDFELHFDFSTPNDVSDLSESLLRTSNRNAYCQSPKLEPFRAQNMPARYRFTDPKNEEINFLVKPSDC